MIATEKSKKADELSIEVMPGGLAKPKRVVFKIAKENKDIICQKKR